MATSSSSSSSSSSGGIGIARVTIDVTGGGLASGGASAGIGQSSGSGTPIVVSVGLAERGAGPVTLIEVGPIASPLVPMQIETAVQAPVVPAAATVEPAGTPTEAATTPAPTVLGRLDQALDLIAAGGGVSLTAETVQATPAAEVFTHAAGTGSGTVVGFDPVLDSLLLVGETNVNLLLTEADATVSLTDGTAVLLDLGAVSSAWGLV